MTALRSRMMLLSGMREAHGLGTTRPLFRVDGDGRASDFGRLTNFDGAGSRLLPAGMTDWLRDDFAGGLFPGLPWFLDDQRPQGYLGRHFARRLSRELGFPKDIDMWSDYDVLVGSLLLHGEHAPSNFVLGEGARVAVEEAICTTIDASDRLDLYSCLAEGALSGESEEPWVGGEQPKFTAALDGDGDGVRHVIVKFTEPTDSGPAARRWADLLICEHLASVVLTEQGDVGARTDLVWSRGRLCLEVTRFDRLGARGRRGCVSLAAWSDAHDGERDDWAGAVMRMHQGGWLDADTVERVRLRWWFGRMIANTDMHFGNLNFFLDEALPLRLTPSYDMLPMLYRPTGNGSVVAREFRFPSPAPVESLCWHKAAAWAELYWSRVAQHAAVSDDFRRIAEANGKAISWRRRYPDKAGSS